MTQASHQLARAYFAAVTNGELPDELLTPDMTAWTTTPGTMDKAIPLMQTLTAKPG
jgi:hypothetical protein